MDHSRGGSVGGQDVLRPGRVLEGRPALQGGRAASLEPYVPRLVVDWLRETPDATVRQVEGSLAFVDISGFTMLTERLALKGKVGAEELSDLLNATFAQLLVVAYLDGAGLVKWGGDAILLLFDGPDHAARACRAAYRMRTRMRRIGTLNTTAGRVSLRMSVGIHSGTFHFFLVGDPAVHRELLVSGPAASTCAELEALAAAGEIVISPAPAALLRRSLVGAPKAPSRRKLRAPSRSPMVHIPARAGGGLVRDAGEGEPLTSRPRTRRSERVPSRGSPLAWRRISRDDGTFLPPRDD